MIDLLQRCYGCGTRIDLDKGVSRKKKERRKAMTEQIELNVEEMEEMVAPGFLLGD